MRKFDRAKCRVMSIAWGPPKPPRSNVGVKGKTASEEEDSDDDDDEWIDEWLVTGGSDSSLRKWDVKTGRVVDKMITDKLKKQATLVWAVTVLAYVASFYFILKATTDKPIIPDTAMARLFLVTRWVMSRSGTP